MNIKRAVKKLFASCGFEIRRQRHSPEMRSSVQQFVQSLHLRRSPVCFDVGANSGQTIDAFRKRVDDPTIYAFEPSVSLYNELKYKYKDLLNVTIVNKGLSDAEGKLDLYINTYSTLNSIHEINNSSDQKQGKIRDKEEIYLTTLDIFLSENNIDYVDVLKIDVQGHELHVLMGGESFLSEGKFEWIIVEILFGDCYHIEGNQMMDILKLLGKKYYVHSIIDLTYIGDLGRLSHADVVFKKR